ncbi:MAG: PfkB family carbohydrate kinase [Trueperaceae bacterium]
MTLPRSGPAAAGPAVTGRPGRVVALGEALVDLLPGPPAADRPGEVAYYPAAGGAPANVAVGAARLGATAGFIGALADDPFGRFLLSTLRSEGVDTDHVVIAPGARTALAFVTHGEGGERRFHFYREDAADLRLHPLDVDAAYIASATVLHVGSLSLTGESARSATLHAVASARRLGVPVSVDANLRLDLWPTAGAARREVLALAAEATVLKLSEDELEFLTGARGEPAARSLFGSELELLCVTQGARGTAYFTRAAASFVPAFAVEPVDTTGAGDAFVAALLAAFALEGSVRGTVADPPVLAGAIRRAYAFAALTVTRPGAIAAMPRQGELDAFLRSAGPS